MNRWRVSVGRLLWSAVLLGSMVPAGQAAYLDGEEYDSSYSRTERARGGLSSYGGTQDRSGSYSRSSNYYNGSSYDSRTAPERAPEHLRYLSVECAQLNDALRTGPSRGLKSSTLAELRSQYSRQCGQEDSEARQRVWQEQSQQGRERKAQQQADQEARRRSAEQLSMRASQCREMLHSLNNRRQRFDTLTEGERGDLRRFEANYEARCKSE